MNKEELIKEYDKKAKALRDEFISKLEDDKKEFELTYPKEDEVLYYIDLDGKIHFFDNSVYDLKTCYPQGELFYSEEEAQAVSRERKLLFKLHQWAKEKNEGWEPDWESIFQEKYYIFYDYYRKELCTSFNNSTGAINKLPYFKTRKIAQEYINLFGEEIKEVLC